MKKQAYMCNDHGYTVRDRPCCDLAVVVDPPADPDAALPGVVGSLLVIVALLASAFLVGGLLRALVKAVT